MSARSTRKPRWVVVWALIAGVEREHWEAVGKNDTSTLATERAEQLLATEAKKRRVTPDFLGCAWRFDEKAPDSDRRITSSGTPPA